MYPVLNYAMLSFLKLFQLLYRRNSRPRSDLFHDLLKLSGCGHNDISADFCSQGNEKLIQNKNKIKGEKNSETLLSFLIVCIYTSHNVSELYFQAFSNIGKIPIVQKKFG